MGELFGADSVENQLANQMEHDWEVGDMGLSKNRGPQECPQQNDNPYYPPKG